MTRFIWFMTYSEISAWWDGMKGNWVIKSSMDFGAFVEGVEEGQLTYMNVYHHYWISVNHNLQFNGLSSYKNSI